MTHLLSSLQYCVTILPRQTQLLSSKPILFVIHGSNIHLSQSFLERDISEIENILQTIIAHGT